jgi:hypothetical protein
MHRTIFAALLATSASVAPAVLASTVNGAYSLTVINGDSRGLAFQPNVPVILEDGTVVYAEGNSSGISSAPRNTVVFLGDDGARREVVLSNVEAIRQISANAAGQFVALVQDQATDTGRVILVEADGTTQTLLNVNGFTGAAVPTRTVADIQINASGIVAAFVSVETGDALDPVVERVLRITPDASGTPTVDILDESRPVAGESDFRDLTAGVTIDDSGRIGWRASLPAEQQILVDDGTGAKVIYKTSNRPVLNNEGEALVIGPFPGFGIGTTDVTDGVPNDFSQITPGDGCAEGDLNDYGQVVCLTNDGRLFLDGEVQLRVGDVVGGLEIESFTSGGGPRLVSGEALNDSGQIVVEATLVERDANGNIVGTGFESGIIRLDPIGATPGDPILPTSTSGDVNLLSYEIVNALGFETPIFVDPVVRNVFDYELGSGSPLFTSLVIPDQDLGAEDGMFDVIFGSFTETIAFGDVLDFSAYAGLEDGIDFFTIAGIDPGSNVTTDNPFIVGLTHAGLGTVNLSITGRTVVDDDGGQTEPPNVIPLPASAWLLIGGIAGLLTLRRRSA